MSPQRLPPSGPAGETATLVADLEMAAGQRNVSETFTSNGGRARRDVYSYDAKVTKPIISKEDKVKLHHEVNKLQRADGTNDFSTSQVRATRIANSGARIANGGVADMIEGHRTAKIIKRNAKIVDIKSKITNAEGDSWGIYQDGDIVSTHELDTDGTPGKLLKVKFYKAKKN